MIRYLPILFLLLLPQLSTAAAGIADVPGEDPGLFMVTLVVLAALVFMVLSGLFILAVLAGIFFLLTAVGIISASVLTGWYHRSFSKGLTAFFRWSFIAAGCFAALILLFILDAFQVSVTATSWFWIVLLATGAIAGWLWFVILQKVVKWMLQKVRR